MKGAERLCLALDFSTRARVIVYNKEAVKPGEIRSYEDLADPKWKGRAAMARHAIVAATSSPFAKNMMPVVADAGI